jgi:hypothetical protein
VRLWPRAGAGSSGIGLGLRPARWGSRRSLPGWPWGCDRRINRVLHILAVVQLRNDTAGRRHYRRRLAERAYPPDPRWRAGLLDSWTWTRREGIPPDLHPQVSSIARP